MVKEAWVGFVLCAVQAAAASDAGAVHEWGTFTSVAGENGQAVDWLPLSGPSDLPCFVERLVSAISSRPMAWFEWKRRFCISTR